jgi:tripartite-type tricarboxylate transporter receptor subunit TctC
MLRLSRRTSALLVAAVMMGGAAPPAWAQTSGPTFTFVVSFAAGGVADVIARLVAQKLTDRTGQKVVVENRAGAGGNLAARLVSTAAPDGNTILATTTALAVNATASRNKGYATEDLRTIAIVASSPDVVALHPSSPIKDLRELVSKTGDRGITFGTPGLGTSPYIAAEYFFRDVAKIKAVHVPFAGGAPAVAAAIGNHVDVIAVSLATAATQIEQGLLRGIGLAAATRNPSVPNVPTYGENGFPDFHSATFVGFFAPDKTPDAVVTKLHAEINEILKEPEAQQKLKTLGFDAISKTHAEAVAHFRGEVAAWEKMSKAIGFSTD